MVLAPIAQEQGNYLTTQHGLTPVEGFCKLFTCSHFRRAADDYNGGVNFQLRDFQRQDFETLWSIDQLCFAPGIAYSREELNLYIRQPGSFTLVAESRPTAPKLHAGSDKNGLDPAILGFLVAEARRGTGHLITIDVLQQVRRAGVGSKLLAAAEKRLRAVPCRRISLETAVDNLSAIAFYKRHQYFGVRTVPRYYSNGTDAMLLEKDLLSPVQAS